jgi:hypothetical protein
VKSPATGSFLPCRFVELSVNRHRFGHLDRFEDSILANRFIIYEALQRLPLPALKIMSRTSKNHRFPHLSECEIEHHNNAQAVFAIHEKTGEKAVGRTG